MMNNCWYIVKLKMVDDCDDGIPAILFGHPAEPGTGKEGWLVSSTELLVADAKQSAGAPQKQFMREEVMSGKKGRLSDEVVGSSWVS